jgi:hypothetical protein
MRSQKLRVHTPKRKMGGHSHRTGHPGVPHHSKHVNLGHRRLTTKHGHPI